MTTVHAPSTPQSAILAILAEDLRLYRRLRAVVEAKRDALLANDLDALAALVREMEGIAAAVARLEEERAIQVGRLLDLGRAGDWTFDVLAAHFAGQELDRLRALRGELRDVVGAVRVLNDLNAGLVRQALAFANQVTRLLAATAPATYGATGAVTGPDTVSRTWTV